MQHRAEIHRWADSQDGTRVWVRNSLGCASDWMVVSNPSWNEDVYYIVDDRHAELRKLQIDEPETIFECLVYAGNWLVKVEPIWNIVAEYRVKPEPKWTDNLEENPVLCWLWDELKDRRVYAQYVKNFDTGTTYPFITVTRTRFKYAEPVKSEECYTSKKDKNEKS